MYLYKGTTRSQRIIWSYMRKLKNTFSTDGFPTTNWHIKEERKTRALTYCKNMSYEEVKWYISIFGGWLLAKDKQSLQIYVLKENIQEYQKGKVNY